jgi:hypothetical protein
VQWRFTVTDSDPWTGIVDAVPVELKESLFIEAAIPQLAEVAGEVPAAARVVVGHVTAPGRNGPPGGPVGRAKGLLDALHDHRRHGPFYRDLGMSSPLVNDDPAHVQVLAIEVIVGHPQTQYEIGTGLSINGQLVARVPVPFPAPNDIAGTPSEIVKILAARLQYGEAVRVGFAQHTALPIQHPDAVVIRHRPQRDADNTWRTWINAICAPHRIDAGHWAVGAPLAGWRPTAVASVADVSIDTPVIYELWSSSSAT